MLPNRTPPSFAATAALLSVVLAGCAGVAAPAAAPPPVALAASIDSIFDDPAFAHAHWGVMVASLDDGDVLYRRNSEKLFVPASNMKLITGAAVLETLGPDYRFRTEIGAGGPIRDGVLQGPLVVRGSGDPTLSARFGMEPRQWLRTWADSLRAHGVHRVEGGIVGIDAAISDPPYGRGWGWDALGSAYSAGVTGLQLNEGVVEVQVAAGPAAGEPPVVLLDPPTSRVPVSNQAVTTGRGAPTRLRVDRQESGPGLVVAGEIAVDAEVVERRVSMHDPTDVFVGMLQDALTEAGIVVDGPAVDADRVPGAALAAHGATPIFVYRSPPLREVLPAMMKPSQNWIAETLLRTLGRELQGEGSARAGAAVVDSLFGSWGLDTRELRAADGSGLSRYNLVSPQLLIGLLTHMAQSPHWDVWYASLPVAGVDGTLASRMRGTVGEGNVRAKTGTLSGVRALSGYVTARDGERILFSTMLNHHVLASGDADRLIDAMLTRIAGWDR